MSDELSEAGHAISQQILRDFCSLQLAFVRGTYQKNQFH